MGSSAKEAASRSAEWARVTDDIQALIDRISQRDVPTEVSRRGEALAESLRQLADEGTMRAAIAWRESRPMRREIRKTMEKQGRELGRWSRDMWRRELRPGLRRVWNRRVAAYTAAGAAIPAGRQLIEETAADLGLRRRDERHWGAFLAGVLIGAMAGAVAALLTAPKPGRETRDELAARARDAAETAGEWVKIGVAAEGNGSASPQATEVESES
jgi:hypothetical protein